MVKNEAMQEKPIRKYYKPSEQEEKILRFTYERYRKMKDNPQRQDAVKEWDKAEQSWDQVSKADEGREDWQADYFVPLTTSVVESILSEMVDQSPRPIILPWSAEDKPRATVMRHAFDYTWSVADGDDELENVLKDCLIYGNGFAQEYYWKDRRIIRGLSEVNKDKRRVSEKYKEVESFEFDDCYMESVSPYELFFDETARSINRGPYKARDAIRRYVMKLKSAKLFFSGDVWDPYDNMKYVKCGGDTNYYSYYKPPEDIDKSDEVEVLWYWSRSPEDALNIVINDVLIKSGPNPYKHKQLPFAMTYDVKRPHKFYHKGEPKLLESIQKELNTLRRMLTDRNHLDIDKMWLVGRNETYNEEDTISRPHGIIRVDDPANYKAMEYGDVGNSFMTNLQEINKDAVRVTGTDDRFQGGKTPGTATDAAIVKEQVIKRVAAKLRRLEKGFLVDIGRQRVANIIQFYSQPRLEKIVGEAGTQEYHAMLVDAQKRGLLTMQDGEPYKKTFRDIRIENKQLATDATGQIVEQPTKGFSFFEMKPEHFVPVARGGFDIRFEAGSTMPVSKALMAKQTMDLVQLLMPMASAGIGYDPVKLGDAAIEALDHQPEDFKPEAEPEEQINDQRSEMMINLATQENKEVASGNPIPPMGTPYAIPAHSMIHIAFMKSPTGKNMPEEQYRLLAKHVMGELTAQASRGDVTGLTGEPNPSAPQSGGPNGTGPQNPAMSPVEAPAPSSGGNDALTAIMPAKIQGGEQLQGTQKGSLASRALSLLRGVKGGINYKQ